MKSHWVYVFLVYAAPEVLSCIDYDPMKSDVWSIGIILFVMLHQRMPFADMSLIKLVKNQNKQSYKDALYSNLSKDCVNIIEKLLEPNPEKRPYIENVYACDWLCKHVKN